MGRGIWAQLSWLLCSGSLKSYTPGISQAGISAEGSSGEGSSSKRTRLLAGCGSSVPNWPHPGGPLRPQLPGPLPPPHSPHRGRQTNQEGSRVDYKMEVVPHPFAHVDLSCVHTQTHMNTHTPHRLASTHFPREEGSLGDGLS